MLFAYTIFRREDYICHHFELSNTKESHFSLTTEMPPPPAKKSFNQCSVSAGFFNNWNTVNSDTKAGIEKEYFSLNTYFPMLKLLCVFPMGLKYPSLRKGELFEKSLN